LVVDEAVEFNKIQAIAKKVEKKYIKEVNLFDIYRNEEQIGKGKKSYSVSFEFENPEKTIKDKEVDKVMNTLIDKYEKELNATIRR
jgi:phenylalanyl-tRNA synthetase beta chain